MKDKTLVVGATGALGRPVVKLLRERGVAVRAACRHPGQAADLAALGAEVMVADLSEPTSLVSACAGVQRVLACAHGLLGRGRWRSERVDDLGHRELVQAAQAAGVRRFVYVSAAGAAPDHPIDFFRTKHAIEQVLAVSGLEHAVLRPTCFMEHHAHNFIGKSLLEKGKAQLIGTGTKLRNFVCAEDVAVLAVRALLDAPLTFRRLEIGGFGHYSNRDVAALYARLAGVPERISVIPAGVARALSVLARPLHPGMARVMALMSLPDDAFSERFDGAAQLEREHGVRLTTLESFVQRQVQAAHV